MMSVVFDRPVSNDTHALIHAILRLTHGHDIGDVVNACAHVAAHALQQAHGCGDEIAQLFVKGVNEVAVAISRRK
jgi:hypothetical protein